MLQYVKRHIIIIFSKETIPYQYKVNSAKKIGSNHYNHKKNIVNCYIYMMVKSYRKRSRISEKKFREILRLFLLDIEASKVSESDLHRWF